MSLVKSVFRGEDGHEEAIYGTTDRSNTEGRGSRSASKGDLPQAARSLPLGYNISDATFYTWRKKYRGMETEDIRRLKQLEAENGKLKRLLADSILDNDALKAALLKKY